MPALLEDAVAYRDDPEFDDTVNQRIADIEIKPKGQDFQALVKAALAALGRDTTLQAIIGDLNTEVYTLALMDVVKGAGGDADLVELTNKTVLRGLEREARKSARGIVKTFERDLLSFVDQAQEAGATEAELPELIAQWNLERSSWKDAQIAITESARAAGRAQREFIDRSRAKGEAYFGNSLQCAICAEVGASSPYELDDPIVGTIFHPNEMDYWDIRVESVDDIWLGD